MTSRVSNACKSKCFTCTFCGSINTVSDDEVKTPTPTDVNNEDRMPFGKYKGMKISDIHEIPEGSDYLKWIMDRDFITSETKSKILNSFSHKNPRPKK